MSLNALRQEIINKTHLDEYAAVSQILKDDKDTEAQKQNALNLAKNLVIACRQNKHNKGTLDAFLQEFGLSNQEGVALMCLAEALLRVPDSQTADRLIAEKIQSGNWAMHQGKSESLFVNASTWGLMLTGNIVKLDLEITGKTAGWVKKLSATLGEPVIRAAVLQAMRIMGGQYVLGTTIGEGLERGIKDNPKGTRFSFDMLGEGARTEEDAKRYYQSYLKAISGIHFLSDDSQSQQLIKQDIYSANSISVKLSALYSRYEYSHKIQAMRHLYPRIKSLCLVAKQYNIGLSIDAEEAARLDLSLDIFEKLAREPELVSWQGLGFVLQAYQKRAPMVAGWLIQLAEETQRKLMVRLVKGAYWDAEIKHAQEQGFRDYPVFTRKANTDASYHHCVNILLSKPNAIFPQFATHNAYTAAYILTRLQEDEYEFQRLHGMGHVLYQQIRRQNPQRDIPVRVYAPIGNHKDLLPYLVRRLLENGANSSFVNRFLDNQVPVDQLIQDIRAEVQSTKALRHLQIPVPDNIFHHIGEKRFNAKGINLDCSDQTRSLLNIMESEMAQLSRQKPPQDVSDKTIDNAMDIASKAQEYWGELPVSQRADILRKAADNLEANTQQLMSIITFEARRTLADGLSEVREAVDFCRYYALQAEQLFAGVELKPKGVFLCISPWNFPLAIFIGQITAALVTGNSVIAKPAEQTPRVAKAALQHFYNAGVPREILQLLLGDGAKIGGHIMADNRLSGVVFTGSTETAKAINQQLAQHQTPVTLIAETGGINCMIADSTALPEQLVDDIIASAFQSAGQRCSALRVLFLQQDIADTVLDMLQGSMQTLEVGDPCHLSTDVGPVIDLEAYQTLQHYMQRRVQDSTLLASANLNDSATKRDYYITPQVYEIKHLEQLEKEVFGPVLHVIRFASHQLDQVIEQINNSGYGLTLGVHSRIQAVADYIYQRTQVGNTYINRNIIGAVVGVNPFGGRGLSGTGPKAGGPHYLLSFIQPNVKTQEVVELLSYAKLFANIVETLIKPSITMPGATGELNTLSLYPKNKVFCLIDSNDSLEQKQLQILAALSCGCHVVVNVDVDIAVFKSLSLNLNQLEIVKTPQEELLKDSSIEAVCGTSNSTRNIEVKNILAYRDGPIIPVIELTEIWSVNTLTCWFAYLFKFFFEKTKTDNLVAKGGNTQLFNL